MSTNNPFKKNILEEQITQSETGNKLVIDFSNLAIIAITSVFKTQEEQEQLTESQIKNVVLGNIKELVKKCKSKYPEVIIAVDNTKNGSYKKEFAPYYKAHRAKAREESKLNWEMIFSEMKNLEQDLKEIFGYNVISIPKLEADDIIGYIANKGNAGLYHTMIISTDGDFTQLHSKFTKQYSVSQGKQIEPKISPKADMIVKIIKGDKKDSVSPVKCPSDFYYNQNIGESDKNPFARAPSIKQAELDTYITAKSLEDIKNLLTEEQKERFDENVKLIDLTILPDEYKEKVEEHLKVTLTKSKSKIYQYLLQNNLLKLIDSIQDF